MGKTVKKVMIKELSQYCEQYSKLHSGEKGDQKERSAIDVVTMFI